MNKKRKGMFVFSRYVTLLVLGFFSGIFYRFFFYLTFFPSYLLLSIVYDVSINGYVLNVAGIDIGIVEACIAGSAYYLLLILNLTTDIQIRKRVYSLIFSLISLLIFNIFRIFFFSILLVENFVYFDILHSLFWHLMSILLVVFIWFVTVWLFKIKKIPFYSDLVFLTHFH